MNSSMDEKRIYVVTGKREETHDTTTLFLACTDDTIPPFVPGQFISIYFPELNTPEGKSYSISNPPGEKTFNITIKRIGEFSRRLCAMESGAEVIGSLPYGFFYSEQPGTDLVMIAGGIGVTPFRSTILRSIAREPTRRLSLFQSARTADELVFRAELTGLETLSIRYFVTREPSPRLEAAARRMHADDVIERSRPEYSEFFICGSISFVRDMWRDLRKNGIPEEKIYTEAFFSH